MQRGTAASRVTSLRPVVLGLCSILIFSANVVSAQAQNQALAQQQQQQQAQPHDEDQDQDQQHGQDLPVVGLRAGESQRETDAFFPGSVPCDAHGMPRYAVTRVVAAVDGTPLASARLSAVAERSFPTPAQWPPLRTAVADADGWVRLRIDDLIEADGRAAYDWLLIEADGCGPRLESATVPDIQVELHPAVDLPVEVLDALGDPAAGVHLGLILGCGHTPDIRTAVTDGRGFATLDAIDPRSGNLWTTGTGLLATEVGFGEWRPGDARVRIGTEPGVTVRGKVLHEDGLPAPYTIVGAPDMHRGPWTRTDALGNFVLRGAGPIPAIVVVPDETRDGVRYHFDVSADIPVTVRLPRFGDGVPETGRDIPIVVDGIEGLAGDTYLIVTMIRQADGIGERVDLPPKALADGAMIRLEPGPHVLRVVDSRQRIVPIERIVDVDETTTEIRLHPVLRPVFELRVAADVREQASWTLVSPSVFLAIDRLLERGEGLPWPGDAPVRLRVERREEPAGVHFLDIPGLPADPLRVIWRRDDQAPGLVSADSPADSAADAVSDAVSGAVPGAVPDAMPDAAAVPRLRVVFGDGSPAIGVDVETARRGVTVWTSTDGTGFVPPREDIRPGDRIRITSPAGDRLAIVGRIAGGEQQFAWGSAVLAFELRDADGSAVDDGAVLLHGVDFEANDAGVVRVRGLRPGAYQCIVTAPGRRSRVLDLTVREADERRLTVTMSAAP